MAKGDDETNPAAQGSVAGAGDDARSAASASGAAKAAPQGGEAKPAPKAAAQAQAARAAGKAGDAIAMLKEDHRKLEGLFTESEGADERRRDEIIDEACEALVIHALLEERIFYPAARQPATEDKLEEAQVEHDAAKVLIVELMEGDDADEYRRAKFKVLAEEMKHHIREEEAPDGVFAKAQKAGVDTPELAQRMTALKQQLQQQADAGRLAEPAPASFQHFGQPQRQESYMPRERDDEGRFMSEDDRSYRSRGRDDDDRGRSRDSSGRERDSQGRFTNDDDRGYRARDSRDDDDRGRSRGASGRERDSQGRFISDDDDGRRGRSYAAHDEGRSYRDDDDDRGYRSRSGGGHGGWSGDPEGHSEASRRGWEEREGGGRSRAYRDDDDDRSYRSRSADARGQGGWFGDSEGHAEAARRGWENSDHGRSGWYGDSEGHSEASRRGWDERGAARSSGRYEERSYARGRDYDDDDRGRGSGGRGGGGWSGDPEGHAEAARRGWRERR